MRQMTVEEMDIVARVARATDKLRAQHFNPAVVVLSYDLWGEPSDHFTNILGLPVVKDNGGTKGQVFVGVFA